MNELILFGLLVLNFAISWWNAREGGKYWTESKITGGFIRILLASALIMSAAGFTWCYLTILAILGVVTNFLTAEQAQVMFSLGYIIIWPVVVGVGIPIWAHSLIRAWRERTLGTTAVAGYNTFAMAHNVISGAKHMPNALGDVMSFFGTSKSSRRRGSSSGQGAAGLVVILLVILAIAGGTLTTIMIARDADEKHVLDMASAADL